MKFTPSKELISMVDATPTPTNQFDRLQNVFFQIYMPEVY